MPRPTLTVPSPSAEDPAVAGQQDPGAVRLGPPQLQPGLEVVVVGARAGCSSAGPRRPSAGRPAWRCPARARAGRTPRRRPAPAARGTWPGRPAVAGLDADDPAGRGRAPGRSPWPARAAGRRPSRRAGPASRRSRAAAGPARSPEEAELRPGQLQPAARRRSPAGPCCGSSRPSRRWSTPMRDQAVHGARGQPVAAHLLPREGRLLQQQHVQPGLGQVVRRRRAGRAGADDDDVSGLFGNHWQSPPRTCERVHELVGVSV